MSGGNQIDGILQRTTDESSRFRYLRISSYEKISGTNYMFAVNFGNDIRLESIVKVNVVSVTFPNVFYNIYAGSNTMTLVVNLVNNNFTIPPGRYTVNQVLIIMQTQLNATYGANYFTLSIDSRGYVNITSSNLVDTLHVLSSPLATLLGFLNNTPTVHSLTASAFPNFLGATMLFIHSDNMTPNITYINSINNNVNDINGFLSIPITDPWGASVIYFPNDQDRITLNPTLGMNLKTINFTLRVNGGRLATEFVNGEFIMVLKVFYK
jgi:hypothetical protein